MKISDILKKSDSFAFFINGMELAIKVVKELKRLGFSYDDPDMDNIFTDCVKVRTIKYRFDIKPKEKKFGLQPAFGSTSTELTTLSNPVFSQDIMVFILWLIKNEEALDSKK